MSSNQKKFFQKIFNGQNAQKYAIFLETRLEKL